MKHIFDNIEKMDLRGVCRADLNKYIHTEIEKAGLVCGNIGYQGYPSASCISVNNEIAHSIPYPYIFKQNDWVQVDFTTFNPNTGLYTDASRTYFVGHPDKSYSYLKFLKAKSVYSKLINNILAVIKAEVPINIVGQICREIDIEDFIIVKELGGHSIGTTIHSGDTIHYFPNVDKRVFKTGCMYCIEPFLALKPYRIETLPDGWTMLIQSKSYVNEHMILVTEKGCEIICC